MTQLGLEAIPLRDPSDTSGGAYIDRLDALRGVDYAIVLLSEGEGALLEIGFLLGAIGRARMCFVVAGNPVLAPHWEGVARHAIDDAGLWRLLLAREMRQAGLDVDMNRAASESIRRARGCCRESAARECPWDLPRAARRKCAPRRIP